MLREFSNRFGVLISRMAVSEIPKTIRQMKLTKSPDKSGVVTKPTQSMAGPNRLVVVLMRGCSWKWIGSRKESTLAFVIPKGSKKTTKTVPNLCNLNLYDCCRTHSRMKKKSPNHLGIFTTIVFLRPEFALTTSKINCDFLVSHPPSDAVLIRLLNVHLRWWLPQIGCFKSDKEMISH